MKFISITEAIRNILKHCKLLKDINIMDMIRHHYGSRSTGSSSHYVQYINKITRFYTIMAQVTGNKFHLDSFQMYPDKIDKSITKAVDKQIHPGQHSAMHVLPRRFHALMNFKNRFKREAAKQDPVIGQYAGIWTNQRLK